MFLPVGALEERAALLLCRSGTYSTVVDNINQLYGLNVTSFFWDTVRLTPTG
jgi:hypothetical protein